MPSAFDTELALDRFEAHLARDLPPFDAAAAHAYATATLTHATPPMIAPADLALVRSAWRVAELRVRATQLVRIVVPLVVESDATVARLREASPTWEGMRALAAARSAVTMRHFHLPALLRALADVLSPPLPRMLDHGPRAPRAADIPPHPATWRDADGLTIDDAAVHALWSSLATPATGSLEILRTARAHPRTFVVERGVRAIIVVPETIASPAHRFSLLHELGHAWLWLHPSARTREWPRAIDEACASYFGRMLERPAALPAGWAHPAANSARHRRTSLALLLDHLETTAIANPAALADDPGVPATPPWALWHDPAAQTAYVSAESIADTIPAGTTGDALAAYLADLADETDARLMLP